MINIAICNYQKYTKMSPPMAYKGAKIPAFQGALHPGLAGALPVGRHSPKFGDGERRHIDSLLISLSLPMTPQVNNSSQINFKQFLSKWPPFCQHFVKFTIVFVFLSKICPNLFFEKKRMQKFVLFSIWLFFRSYWMTHFFKEKYLTEAPLLLKCCSPSTLSHGISPNYKLKLKWYPNRKCPKKKQQQHFEKISGK